MSLYKLCAQGPRHTDIITGQRHTGINAQCLSRSNICSDIIDVFSVKCAALILVFSYLYALVYGDINLFCLMFVYFIYYVIKMKIKQLKIFFLCLYFNPVLSRNSFTTCTSVLQMYIVGNLVQQNSTCILYFGDVTFWLCRTSDISKYFLHSLGL